MIVDFVYWDVRRLLRACMRMIVRDAEIDDVELTFVKTSCDGWVSIFDWYSDASSLMV
jgi:hypothetical protein